jgi:toxin CcdB
MHTIEPSPKMASPSTATAASERDLPMARFDLYPNCGPHAGVVPYLLDVQSDLLDRLDTRVVVPLRLRDQFPAAELPQRLMPVFDIDGCACMMETPKLGAVPTGILGAPTGSLKDQHDRILGALDFLFQGY